MRRSRLMRTGVVAVLAAATLAAGSLAANAAEADGPYQRTYAATASADGLRVTMTLPAAPLSNTVADVGGPTAQAVLDSNGAGRSPPSPTRVPTWRWPAAPWCSSTRCRWVSPRSSSTRCSSSWNEWPPRAPAELEGEDVLQRYLGIDVAVAAAS